MVRNSVYSLQC